MTITPIQLVAGQYLTGSAAVYYTSTNIKTRIDKATLSNSDASTAHTVTVYLVPSGASPGASNIVIVQRSIASKITYHCPELVGHILSPGDTLQAFADTTNEVSFAAAGVTISP